MAPPVDASRRPAPPHAASKVPEVTLWFWLAKLLTTGMGETAWDWSAHTLGPVPAVVLSGLGFVVALALQFAVRTYRAAVYWFAVVMVSVFGTTAADAVHVVLGVPYAVSTVALLVALVVIFAVWRRVEGTLSIHSIRTRRREVFYWAAVVVTFALGTAVGDLTATTAGWGYLASAVVFAVAFAVPGLAHRFARLDGVLAFWAAYVLTRPFGASVADWLGVPAARGGVDVGTGPVTLVLLVAIVAVVAYLAVTRVDVEPGTRTGGVRAA